MPPEATAAAPQAATGDFSRQGSQTEGEDVGLISRLQGRIRQLEWEKSMMRREMGKKRRESVDVSEAPAADADKTVYESMKVSGGWVFGGLLGC